VDSKGARAVTGAAVVEYLDRFLRTEEVPDYPHALNGLQVERRGGVERVAFAVDASQRTIEDAVARHADLLIVHHGLFWDGLQPVTGRLHRRLGALLAADLGLYSSHLPLDVHPEVGNNVVLATALGVQIQGTFGDYRGVDVGVWGALDIRREALAARLDQILGGRVRMIAGGPERIARVGVVTGGGGGKIGAAVRLGLDALITGEGAHHNYFDAVEGGLSLYLGGHYATEVWGLKALAEHVRGALELDCFFLDHPTGL
jgi:dinuclear metal center YbgI/SA1388 family protein